MESIFTRSTLIREYAVAGKVQVVGAVYDIASGNIQWLGQHPETERLLGKVGTTKEISYAHDTGSHDANPDSHTPVPAKVEAAPVARHDLPAQAISHPSPARVSVPAGVSEDDLLLEAVARGRR